MKKLLAAALAAFLAAAMFAATNEATTTPAASIYKKAKTEMGMCYIGYGIQTEYGWSESEALGTVTVKFGALNKRKGTLKVTMTITPFVGKKQSASKVVTPDEDGNISDALTFKSIYGTVNFNVYSEYWTWEDEDGTESGNWFIFWEASSDNLEIFKESMGGYIYPETLYFGVSPTSELPLPEDYEMLMDPPSDEIIHIKNHKQFTFDKAPSISYKRYNEDGDTWYELSGLDDENKTNYSALKLNYKVKTGAVSGSFKIYATNEGAVDDGKKPKIKKYTAKVNAVLLGGGYYGVGKASVKIGRETYVWPVNISTDEDEWGDDWSDWE